MDTVQPIKICLYAICKNEQHNISNFVNAAKLFDDCVVLDTGSTDDSVNLLKQAGIKVYEKQFEEFDFSVARNTAASLVPEDCVWMFSLDFNEELTATKEQIESIKASEYDALSVECRDYYNPDYVERKLKIHRKNKFEWKFAVHEYLDSTTSVSGISDITVTKKLQNVEHKKDLYRLICEREHARYPTEAHYCWWATTVYKDFDDSRYAYFCDQYLKNTVPYTVEFRVYAFIGLSEFFAKINKDKSIDYAIHALSESLVFKYLTAVPFNKSLHHLTNLGVNITLV